MVPVPYQPVHDDAVPAPPPVQSVTQRQGCEMAVIIATFQKSGCFKSWMAVKNSWL